MRERSATRTLARWIRGGFSSGSLAVSLQTSFAHMRRLVETFGFELKRTSGSHHIFVRPDVTELLNLQDARGEAKPYQIRQFLRLVERYALSMEERR